MDAFKCIFLRQVLCFLSDYDDDLCLILDPFGRVFWNDNGVAMGNQCVIGAITYVS